ncbi:MAG: 4-alpha-glucanotransferase [Puniceicoccales bacterium]|jgi:4-alpha-glucanotransferase|nr:4-alpha-glucanotransferase [Puniceicoccales bacterium]
MNQSSQIKRAIGCFLHITSLPSEQGIGCFDDHAKQFIDFLKSCGMSYWQVCPFTPTTLGDSPYQGASAFAGNPFFINLQRLVGDRYLGQADIEPLRSLNRAKTDYGAVYCTYWPIFARAYENFSECAERCESFTKFCKNEAHWLDNYALFMALKAKFNNQEWIKWPKEFKTPELARGNLKIFPQINLDVELHKFLQWVFLEQWSEIRRYAHEKGIKIIGDVPIFVGLDSADVWVNHWLFKIKENGEPSIVAGVPPDAFSQNGQLWGNPVFQWDRLATVEYGWWMDRLGRNFELFDVIRLDHFRGFQATWEVDASEKTAANGKWVPSAGMEFFEKVMKTFPMSCFIAEDLGQIDEGTRQVLAKTGFPGMNVLHFAFDGQRDNKYLPHFHEKNSVLYLGTHDNDTTRGWFESLPTKNCAREYLRTDCSDITWDLIKKSFESVSNLLVLTMQDILNLGSEARMNTPSMTSGNWTWRMVTEQLDMLKQLDTDKYLRHLAEIYGRLGNHV